MPDRSVRLRLRTRPLRFAFLVMPSDDEAVTRVRQACTIRWGGMLSPIIPAFRRRPSWATDPHLPSPSALDLARGYLESFEPDYVVDCGTGLSAKLGIPDRMILQFDDFESPDWRSAVSPGVGSYEVYRHAYETQHQFVRRTPDSWLLPSSEPHAFSGFSATVLGDLAADGEFSYVREGYRQVFEPDEVSFDPGQCACAAIGREGGTPIDASMQHIKPKAAGSRVRLPLVMNPDSILDQIDFWNLRAFGLMPTPLPIGFLDGPLEKLCDVDPRPFQASRSQMTTIARTPRVDPEVVSEVISRLQEGGV